MVRADRLGALIALASLGACKSERATIDTPIELALASGDEEAKTRLLRLELEVWPAASGACLALSAWRRSVCGGACTDAPSPRDRGEMPEATAALVRDAGGGWPALELPALSQGPWELAVRGIDANGAVFLHACRAVAPGKPWTVTLWRPWCDVAVCAGQFHPACTVVVDCEGSPTADDPDGLAAPVCRAVSPLAFSWEEAGVACPPDQDANYFAPCLPARVACEPGSLTPERDGICPRMESLSCDATADQDIDCNGKVPGPCESCTPGQMQRCTRRGSTSCVGMTTCGEDHRWGDCVFKTGGVEACDGVDADCDGIDDAHDPDAITFCNTDRPRDAPIADSCDGRACRCGQLPACRPTQKCERGACVPYVSSPSDAATPDAVEPDAQVVDPDDSGAEDAGTADATPDAEPIDFDSTPHDAETPALDASSRRDAAPDASRG